MGGGVTQQLIQMTPDEAGGRLPGALPEAPLAMPKQVLETPSGGLLARFLARPLVPFPGARDSGR